MEDRKNKIKAEIRRVSQEFLTNVCNKTKLHLKYKLKGEGGHIKNVMDW